MALAPLDAALAYAERGWVVIPLHTITSRGCSCPKHSECGSQGKHPRTPKGLRDGSRDPEQLRAWWGRWPRANVGVVTGEVSGIVVVDVDVDKGGFGSLDDMQDEYEQLEDTYTVSTGGGGEHRYFRWPGKSIPNRGGMRSGIDVRGDGGYVVAPPSNHKSGRQYETTVDVDELAELPDWLEVEIREKEEQPRELPVFTATDWDGSTPDAVAALVDDGGRVARLWKRDKRLKSDGGDPSKLDFEIACERYRKGIEDPETLVHGLMASRHRDPDAWARVRSKSADYFARTVANAMALVDKEQAEVDAVKRQTHKAFTDSYPMNEKGNTDRFLAINGRDLLYHVTDGRWLVWDGQRFAPDDAPGRTRGGKAGVGVRIQQYLDDLWVLPKLQSSVMRRADAEKFARKSGTAGHMSAIMRMAQDRQAIVEQDLDPDAELLNCENGVVDIRTGELRPHDRAYRCTQVAGAPYYADEESVAWEVFLEETIPDLDVRLYFQRCVGYSLLGVQPEQVFFFIHGRSGTGKSTVLKAIEAAVGSYHRAAAFDTFLDQGGRSSSGPSSDIARLARCRMVSSVEVGGGKKLDDGLVKQLSGGDTVTARKLFGDETEWHPQMALWLVANDRPKGRVEDDALWRRLRPFAFEQSVGAKGRDPRLSYKLASREHRSAVLAWIVRGAQLYLGDGDLTPPPAVQAGIDDYRASSNPLTEFYRDSCSRGEGARIERSLLWRAYKEWCGDNEARTLQKGTFFSLVGSDHRLTKTGGHFVFEGISTQPEAELWGKKGRTEGVG